MNKENPGESTTEPIPPSPVVTGSTEQQAAHNPWLTVATTFAINSQTPRPANPPKGVTIVLRSAFRAGELRVTDEGMEFVGQGSQPLAWLANVGWAGWALIVFGNQVLRAVTINSGMLPHQRRAASLGILMLGFLVLYGTSALNSARRVPVAFRIPWSNIIELQVHPKLLWAVLLFLLPSPKPGGKPQVVSLPIGGMQPSLIAALTDAVERHIPGRSRARARLFDPMLILRQAISIVYLGFVIVVMAVGLWVLLHH